MSFKKLLADLAVVQKDVLAKSTPGDAGDANIQQAGATGGDSNDPAAGDSQAQGGATGTDTQTGATGDDSQPGGEGGAEGDLNKGFEIELDDGSKFKAIDAGPLLEELQKSITTMEGDASKALGVCVDLIKSQQTQIDLLSAGMKKLAGTGGGRKAILSIAARTPQGGAGGDMNKGGAGGGGEQTVEAMKPAEFLVKAEQAFNAKKLSGGDLGLIETYINRAEPIPTHLIQRVAAAVSLAA